MRIVKFEEKDGNVVFVNAKLITAVRGFNGGVSTIYTGIGAINVASPPEDVAAKLWSEMGRGELGLSPLPPSREKAIAAMAAGKSVAFERDGEALPNFPKRFHAGINDELRDKDGGPVFIGQAAGDPARIIEYPKFTVGWSTAICSAATDIFILLADLGYQPVSIGDMLPGDEDN